jgi:hypothetical protein
LLCLCSFGCFEKEENRSDDFLSIFVYIDVLGGTFKIRGMPIGDKLMLKEFSRSHYSYTLLSPNTCTPTELKNKNQIAQLKETVAVQKLIGEERIEKYIKQKPKVDDLAINRLKSIAGKIRVE